jgi:hypothetical protein
VGSSEFNLVGRPAVEQGIAIGRGAVWLNLTRKQYAKLTGGDRLLYLGSLLHTDPRPQLALQFCESQDSARQATGRLQTKGQDQ